MANNTNVKESKLKKFGKRLGNFFSGIFNEMKKVVWMNKRELAATTFTVLLACLLFGAVVWLVDAGMTEVYTVLFG